MLTIGSLFSGYGGLDIGVSAGLGVPTRLTWVCEIDPAPARILAHHHPDVPNLGDITAVQWAPTCPDCDTVHTVRVWRFPDEEPVYRCHACGWELPVDQRPAWVPYPAEVITGGFPCQDLSLAGGRAGLREGTRSGLWSHMARAIDQLRPRLVVIENVRGLLSAPAHSDVEPCPWCLGDDDGEPALRALGAVLADLADLGYDAAWYGLRAADVGAPHGRYRVFVVAWPAADADHGGREGWARQLGAGRRGEPAHGGRWADADADRAGREGPSSAGGQDTAGRPDEDGGGSVVAGRGRAAANADGDAVRVESVAQPGRSGAPEPGQPRDLRSAAAGPDGSGRRTDFVDVPEREPHPRGRAVPHAQGDGRDEGRPESARELGRPDAPLGGAGTWGPYAGAVHRWERVLGRVAPPPTERAPKGGQRLAAPFGEWMMGLPLGHVTAPEIGLTRNEQLKAIGNGVVWQQAAHAVRYLLAIRAAALAETAAAA